MLRKGTSKKNDQNPGIESIEIEQRRLADAFESITAHYEQELVKLGKQVQKASRDGLKANEIARLKDEQAALWRLIRRMQAAGRTTRDLEQELREWTARIGVTSSKHPDNPRLRAEFIASELRARGKRIADLESQFNIKEGSAKDVRTTTWMNDVLDVEPLTPEGTEPVWVHADEQNLIGEIESCIREMKRALADPESDALAQELVDFAKQLKELHGYLRLLDRLNGVRRHRLMIGL